MEEREHEQQTGQREIPPQAPPPPKVTEKSMSDMSLEEIQALDRRQPELRPAPSPSTDEILYPSYLDSPYNFSPGSARQQEAAKLSASRRERELLATKRAAQNRAAQKAFRQRKEGHIQELEQQVNRYKALMETHKELQIENHQYRDYISSLQSALIEAGQAVPPPPHGLDIGGSEPQTSEFARESPYSAATLGAPAANMAVHTDSVPLLAQADTPSMAAPEPPSRSKKRKPDTLEPPAEATTGVVHGSPEKKFQNIEPRLMNA